MKTLVIFGASGDLAKKKIFPAMYQNYEKGFQCKYIGYGRTPISDIAFRNIVQKSTNIENNDFLNRFTYIQGDYNTEGLKSLSTILNTDDTIFYLSIPNRFEIVKNIITGLNDNQLIKKHSQIVIEKPFGEDYNSAKQLIDILNKEVGEERIFLIDHYLAKDLVRNLITLRFANPIFENLWSNKDIERIDIENSEKVGIDKRGQYYDKTGAIKDVIQNHGLQLLSLVTMDQPKSLNSDDFHKEKEQILSHIRMFNNEFKDNIKIGQYKGYLDEEFVNLNSKTETSASLQVEIDTPRWNGVPITIFTGKRMLEKRTQITIYFKSFSNCLWKKECNTVTKNKLIINIFPDNNIKLSINTEFNPNINLPKTKELVFNFDKHDTINLPYANALTDIYNKEKSYNPSFNEILFSWKFIDSIEEWLEDKRSTLLKIY